MKPTMHAVVIVSMLMAGTRLRAGDAAIPATTHGRIGVYDSRAVAVAYCGSALHEQSLSALRAEFDQAKAAGDQRRISELNAEGKAWQKRMHMQAFSTAPVDEILDLIKDELPAIKEMTGVTALVSKWDKAGLAKYQGAETVNVTKALIDAFKPNERQRKHAIEIQKRDPIPLDQAERIKD